MSKLTAVVFVFTAIFALSESGIVDTLKKCSIKDMECQRSLYESTMKAIAETGVPELGIPVLDPVELKDITVSVLGMIDLTMVEGVAEGVKNAKFVSYECDFEKGTTLADIYFDEMSVKGRYLVKSAPLIEQILGNVVTGEGYGKVTMEKLYMRYKFSFTIEKHDDGEIYLVPDIDNSSYKYDIGNVTFEADNIKMGGQDISSLVVNFLNQNWSYVMSTFGRFFSDKGVDIQYKYLNSFFKSVPVTKYFIEDLTPFVKS